jgi:hypothetical protein
VSESSAMTVTRDTDPNGIRAQGNVPALNFEKKD